MTQQTREMKGAVAITGGASGIGFSTAQLLMARGWQPWLLDLKREALDAACGKLGIDASRGIVCNVADETSIEEAFTALTAGGADHAVDLVAVVNSAGIGIDKLSVDTSVEEFRRIVDVNLVGSFAVARTAARYWLDRAISGSIVNISSVSGMCGNRGRSAYGASKGGTACAPTRSPTSVVGKPVSCLLLLQAHCVRSLQKVCGVSTLGRKAWQPGCVLPTSTTGE